MKAFDPLRRFRQLILADERVDSPYKKIGRLHVIKMDVGTEVATVKVPEDGRILAISDDEKVGYYFSPNALTAVDLETYKVRGTVELPLFVIEQGMAFVK